MHMQTAKIASTLKTTRTLKELLAEHDRRWEETGRYQGLDRLRLKEEDPAKFELFHAKVVGSCINARESARYIAASVGTRELGEILFMILTPEGDPIACSHGLIGHVGSAPLQVYWMIEHGYEENPGFKVGDIYESNDSISGAPHPADVYTFMPFFWDGELIAWTAAINHISDVGGATGGSLPTWSHSVFTDGFTFPPQKVGENGQYYKSWEWMWRRNTRMGTQNVLDCKMRLAGLHFMEKEIDARLKDVGPDYFREVMREIIEEGRIDFTLKVKSRLVPGRMQVRNFRPQMYKGWTPGFPQSNRNWLLHIPQEATYEKDGTITLDADGASRWGHHHGNSTYGSTVVSWSAISAMFFAYTVGANHGQIKAIDFKLPPGSVMNALVGPDGWEFASTTVSFCSSSHYTGAAATTFQRGFFSRGMLEEIYPVLVGYSAAQGNGVLKGGASWAYTNLEFMGVQSSGGRPYADGLTAIMAPWNPESDCGNAEEWEYGAPPKFYLGRKILTDYVGHGKYRSGMGLQSAWVIIDPKGLMLQNGQGIMTSMYPGSSSGFCGGYPGPGPFYAFFHDTNMRELMKTGGSYPRSSEEALQWIKEGKLKAEKVDIFKHDPMDQECCDGDIVTTTMAPGQGWGDPLERDLKAVEEDLRLGFISPAVARGVYGAVIEPVEGGKDWKADQLATEKLHVEMKEKRMQRSQPVKEWWLSQRQEVKKKAYIEEVNEMYRECLSFSSKFHEQFTVFWQFEKDFTW